MRQTTWPGRAACVSISRCHHLAAALAAVDIVAEQHEAGVVFAAVIGAMAQQIGELGVAAVDVADRIGQHCRHPNLSEPEPYRARSISCPLMSSKIRHGRRLAGGRDAGTDRSNGLVSGLCRRVPLHTVQEIAAAGSLTERRTQGTECGRECHDFQAETAASHGAGRHLVRGIEGVRRPRVGADLSGPADALGRGLSAGRRDRHRGAHRRRSI